jgi:sialic acid synthase SpsE
MIVNDNRTIIIAEAGVNHNGNMDLAFSLIDLAAKAGADIVKFQTFSASRLVTKNAVKADYQVNTTGANESQLEMLQSLELTSSMHDELIAHAAKRKIVFMSTAFDEESLNLLLGKGLRQFKVPSGELTNLAYLRRIAEVAEDVIISTGMADLQEIDLTYKTAKKFGAKEIILLYCVSNYPSKTSDFHLNNIKILKDKFKCRVGLSDHSKDPRVAIAAIACGADVIEKHIALENQKVGLDLKFSLKGNEIKKLRNDIDVTFNFFKKNIFFRSKEEVKSRVFRRSIFITQNIKNFD